MRSSFKEITPAATVFGIIFGIIMTMSFVYSGLKLGFTLAGSTIAAIMGFVFLKYIMGRGTILENNIQQTIASGINVSSAGIIFTLPALFLMNVEFNLLQVILAAIAGSFLGITVIIPLRKQMIEIDQLRFPSGVAVATILKSPGASATKAVLLLLGSILSAFLIIVIKQEWLPREIPVGEWLNLPEYTSTAIGLSLMNFGAGMLAGRGGIPFALGGMIGYWFIAPISVEYGLIPAEVDGAIGDYLYGEMLRPLGIGILIGGALMGVIVSFPAIREAFRSLSKASKLKGKAGINDEMPVPLIYLGTLLSVVFLFITTFIHSDLSVIEAGIIAILGTIWIAVAGLVVAQATGMTDISPVSGLALISITLVLAFTGDELALSVIVGVAVCVAITQCADMMQDLKTGHLVGSRPVMQQIMQYAVAWIGPLVAIFTVYILWESGVSGGSDLPGFGMESQKCIDELPGCLPAPQAEALKTMVSEILTGEVPVDQYLSGGILGGVLSLFPFSGLGVLIGLAMYLPFSITLGFGLGSITSVLLLKIKEERWVDHYIVPLAAGFIIGEALIELVFSIIKIISG